MGIDPNTFLDEQRENHHTRANLGSRPISRINSRFAGSRDGSMAFGYGLFGKYYPTSTHTTSYNWRGSRWICWRTNCGSSRQRGDLAVSTSKGTREVKGCGLTSRAADGGDSVAFSSIFHAQAESCSQSESTPAPPPLTQTVMPLPNPHNGDIKL